MDEDLLVVGVLILILVAIVACLVGGSILFGRAECNAKTTGMGFPHQWTILGGCKIEVQPDKWIPLESYYFKQQ